MQLKLFCKLNLEFINWKSEGKPCCSLGDRKSLFFFVVDLDKASSIQRKQLDSLKTEKKSLNASN